jgi:uncharacterized protein YfaP (DUF2135 family)
MTQILSVRLSAWFRLCILALLTLSSASAQLVNTSVRVRVGTGDETLITGFVIGPTPKTFLFRAIGPSLSIFGVGGLLADPSLTLYSGDRVITSNEDWSVNSAYSAATIAQISATAGAFALPANSKDAALIVTLPSGPYTVQIAGANGGTGVALFEAYELAAAPAAGGRIEGRLVDARSDIGIVGARISFRNSAGTEIGTSTTAVFGFYSALVPSGAVTVVFETTAGYIGTSTTVSVVAYSTVQVPTLRVAPNQAGSGTIAGRITNALNGGAAAGVTLRFRAGVDVRSGTVLGTVTTDATGNFSVPLPVGSYTAEVAGAGFITGYFSCFSLAGQTSSNQNYAISPSLGANEFRVVLTWGFSPTDLDAHLTGPLENGSRFHVFFDSKVSPDGGARLDVDDESSYGPESITLTQFRSGVYRYSVHDYTNSTSTTSTALSNSGAQVTVYQGTSEIARFTAPSGRTGNLWTVFEMDGATKSITAKNEFSSLSAPSRVAAPAGDGSTPTDETEVLRIGRKPKS